MKYHNITHDDILNGDGLRVVLWVSGCSHKCEGCHNQITWDENDGLEFTDVEKQEIFNSLDKDYISGITFSGGDPFYINNRTVILNLISEIKEKYPNKNIWVYTGYLFEDILEWNVNLSDIDVIVDGKFIKDLKDNELPWVGSSNQRVIDVQETLRRHILTTLNY